MIIGNVIKGEQKGRLNGFPTANIENTENISTGIYAGFANLDGIQYDCAIYIGTPRPDIIEIHFIEYSGDLYGKKVGLSLIKKIREDMYECDNSKLIEMIKTDISNVKKELEEYKRVYRNN